MYDVFTFQKAFTFQCKIFKFYTVNVEKFPTFLFLKISPTYKTYSLFFLQYYTSKHLGKKFLSFFRKGIKKKFYGVFFFIIHVKRCCEFQVNEKYHKYVEIMFEKCRIVIKYFIVFIYFLQLGISRGNIQNFWMQRRNWKVVKLRM